MKHLKHLFTTLFLLFTSVATAHDFEVDGIYYNITDATNKTVAVTYRGSSFSEYSNEYTGSVVIPETVTYNDVTYNVTSIGDEAFYRCSGLTSIDIPNSVTSIGDSALYYCSGLTSIEIPNSVTSIGDEAFYRCSGLTSIEIPNSVTNIGDEAFRDCLRLKKVEINCVTIGSWFSYNTSIEKVVIGDSVTSIGSSAFYNCSGLTSVVIPNSVTSIGESAFNYCFGLTSITIPNSVTSIGSSAFSGCKGLTSVTIGNSVTSIGNAAFYGCSGLTSAVIGNSVTSIGSSAFSGCSGLTSIDIPYSVTSIGEDAFYGCSGLKTVVNFSNLTFKKGSSGNGYIAYYADNVINAPGGEMLGEWVFFTADSTYYLAAYLGDDTEITLPENYKGENYVIGADTFRDNTTLTKVTIPNSVTSIGEMAFYYCSGLTSVTIGNSVTSIGSSAFRDCSGLTSVVIPNCVTSIGNRAFEGTAWYNNQPDGVVYAGKVLYKYKGTMPENTSITIEEGTLGIADYAFRGCYGLTSIDIPKSVTSIGNFAFYSCYGLRKVVVPENITYIGESAFENCTALAEIRSFIPAERLFVPDDYAFEGVDKDACILYVPQDAKEVYATTAGWSDFANIIEGGNMFTVTYIVDGEVYATDSVAYGDEVVLIDEPVREGYTFSGWSEVPAIMPAEDITVTGTFTKTDTGIDQVLIDSGEVVIYDLNGLRIVDVHELKRGVYILNGKKQFVK